MLKKKMGKLLLAAIAAATVAGTAEASIFGPVSGSGWSIFGPVNGSGWDINHDGKKDIGDWSIFGPVNGSGWNIDCLFNCSGNFGLSAAARNGMPVLVARPSHPMMVPVMVPVMVAPTGGPAMAGTTQKRPVECTFSENVALLARSVDDCEAAGGDVAAAANAAADPAASSATSNN